jgi:amino acid permease
MSSSSQLGLPRYPSTYGVFDIISSSRSLITTNNNTPPSQPTTPIASSSSSGAILTNLNLNNNNSIEPSREPSPISGNNNNNGNGGSTTHNNEEKLVRKNLAIHQATYTLGASILGTGLLSMPKAVELTGICIFLVLSLIASYGALLSAQYLLRTVRYLHTESFRRASALRQEAGVSELTFGTAAYKTFGIVGERVALVSLLVQQTGACICYIVVVGDVFTPLVQDVLGNDQVPAWAIRFMFAWSVMFPLSILTRNLSSLSWSSPGAVMSICLFGVAVIGNAMVVFTSPVYYRTAFEISHNRDDNHHEHHHHHHHSLETNLSFYPDSTRNLLRGLPLVVFAYYMHFNVIPVKNAIRTMVQGDDVIEVFDIALYRSFIVSTLITVGIGLAGYYTFQHDTEPDILSNFPVINTYISPYMNIVRAFYGLGLLLAFPVVLFELREISLFLLFGTDITEERYIVLTFAVVAITSIIGCTVPDIAIIFTVVGSTSTPILSFILPSALYLKSGAAKEYGDSFEAWLCLLCGMASIPLGIYGTWVDVE